LLFEAISSVAGNARDSLTLGPFGPIGEDIRDRLQSARIAEAGEDERNVAADVPILVTKPVGEQREHARVVFASDGLGDLDLLPKHFFVFELFDKRTRSLRGDRSALR